MKLKEKWLLGHERSSLKLSNRSQAVDKESEAAIIDEIRWTAALGNSAAGVNLCITVPLSIVTRSRGSSMKSRKPSNHDQFFEIKCTAQEEVKLQVLGTLLDEKGREIVKFSLGSMFQLGLNLDEVGRSKWAEQHTRKVIILSSVMCKATHNCYA
jgi:hypothetical protein